MRAMKRFVSWKAIAAMVIFSVIAIYGKTILATTNEKLIELILDASGSMNGKLTNGRTKISAARDAVAAFVQSLDENQQLSFRAYGHQSPREKHDCHDTQLLVPFAKLSENREKILSYTRKLNPRGYTPISFVLGLAIKDFPESFTGEKVIILISDGKETCEGDPCALATALKKAHPTLFIHTIGLGVNEVTRDQLTCIAEQTGGRYFDASDAKTLAKYLSAAISVKGEKTTEKQGMGWLEIAKPSLRGHKIIDAKTGKVLEKEISATQSKIELPAGIYNVVFGKSVWKSVVVKAGETKTLIPGWLIIRHASYKGHPVLDPETGEEVAKINATNGKITILPGKYDVLFGKATWQVTVKKGEETELNPGIVRVKHADIRGHKIFDHSGRVVATVSATGSSFPLPPGNYSIQIRNKKINFSLKEGENKIFVNE